MLATQHLLHGLLQLQQMCMYKKLMNLKSQQLDTHTAEEQCDCAEEMSECCI